MQLQTYVAADDPSVGETVRADWQRLRKTVHLPLGADAYGTTAFLTYGMLVNSLASMGFPPEHRIREGLYPSARPPT